ncbi:DUF6907 domain-containing protein [Streptomyces sp. NPDC090493]|uniref:DUF6907 domain-containing protein n=1 Tax=Streptomyces sp. NPDC090493 TaxID=3365964 RepID=UPI003802239E
MSERSLYPVPEVKPGHRLVPAGIGKPSEQVMVFVECPDWCNWDHVADGPQHASDIFHQSSNGGGWDTDCLTQPGDRMISLDAYLHADPTATDPNMRAAHIVLDDESTEAYLTPDMTDRVADDLIAFAAHLRQLAQRARRANALTGTPPRRSRSQVDEAPRRVHGGVRQSEATA